MQLKSERLEYERPGRFFLVGKLAFREPVRVRLSALQYEQRPDASGTVRAAARATPVRPIRNRERICS